MVAKRLRVAIEQLPVEQAALPAVCYLPTMLHDATGVAEADPTTAAAAEAAAKRLKYTMHMRPRSGASIQMVHATLGDVEYVGRSDGPENAGAQACSYALGVYRPDEGKLQLVPVAGGRIFRVDARLPGLVYAPTGAGPDDARDYRDEAKRLVDEFGSTRRRRQLVQREAGVVKADRVSGGDAVQKMLGNIAAQGQDAGMTEKEMAKKAFEARTVPPHNAAATSPREAYPLQLLLGSEELVKCLERPLMHKLAEDQEEYNKVKEKRWVNEYVLARLTALRALKQSPAPDAAARAKAKVGYLALLTTLFKILDKKVAKAQDSTFAMAKELHIREGMVPWALEKFYVSIDDPLRGPRHERPEAQKQLLLSYICAAAVVAEDGVLDKEQFEELRTALQMESSKLANVLTQIGCSVKSAKMKAEREGVEVDVGSYVASLLRDPRNPNKTLAEAFPALAGARRGRPKRG